MSAGYFWLSKIFGFRSILCLFSGVFLKKFFINLWFFYVYFGVYLLFLKFSFGLSSLLLSLR